MMMMMISFLSPYFIALFGLQMSALGAELRLISPPLQHTEAPHWDEVQNVLYFVDEIYNLVVRYDPETKARTQVYIAGGSITPVLTVYGSNDKFVVGRGRDLLTFEWDGISFLPFNVEVLTTVEPFKTGTTFNDGKADKRGRIWIGTIETDEGSNNAGFYQFPKELNFSPVKILTATISNGLTWNNDSTLFYYIDSKTRTVDIFDFDDEAAIISNRRHLFNVTQHGLSGGPDGMTIDTDGNLWVANWGGGAVLKVDSKTGQLLEKFEIPVEQVSSCVWGGKNLDILFITTSRLGLSTEDIMKQPLAGSVFSLTNTGSRGYLSDKVRF